MNFAPLHVYTGYSFLKSGLTVERYISLVKKNHFCGAAISDFATLSGIPLFAKAMKKEGLPYLVGMDVLVDEYLFSMYAIDEEGYRNLLYINNLNSIKALSLSDIKEHGKGLTLIIDTSHAKIKSLYIDYLARFTALVKDLSNIFTGFFFGVNFDDEEYINSIREFAKGHTYSLVAFPSIKYAKKEDAIVLEIVRAIDEVRILEAKTLDGNDYFPNEQEIMAYFKDDEIYNANYILNNAKFDYEIRRGQLLKYVNQDGVRSDIYLKTLAYQGLKEKMGEVDKEHLDRLNYELSVITEMGYCDYFLIVMDYVKFAKDHGISVGPGRGSAAGSLVSYALGIVMVDPLKYDLMFERFLNPERQSMPDIDIDFSDVRRYEVIDYLKQKYGADRVAHIITIQTIGAKQALRDVGRVYNYPIKDIDMISKKIVDADLSLRDDYKTNEAFRALIDSDKYYLDIVSLASKIEGLPRQSGLHAAGIVLNNTPLKDVVPTIVDRENGSICAYEMNYLEEQGLLKMDLLGLRNLTIIDNCIALINSTCKDKLHYSTIPFDDEKAMKLIASGKTMGVFQLESTGMKRAISEIKIEKFEDVMALLALYRPGPMASIPSYARRKEGSEKVTYFSKTVESILKSTYGIIIYQEQISQIARAMAGFSYGQADLFRRAISKKDSQKLIALKNTFIEGSLKNGFKKEEAEKVFALIYKFADYGFNKSHSLCYAILSSQMAYLKAHYTAEFYAAILENSSGNNDAKFNEIIGEMKSLGVRLLPPDINKSLSDYSVVDGQLLFSLSTIKGLPRIMADNIVLERTNGKYDSFVNFVTRMKKYDLSEPQVLSLIDSGAFDTLDASRASLRAYLPVIMKYAEMFFGLEESLLGQDTSFMKLPTYTKLQDDRLDNLEREYDALGIMLSGSPLGDISYSDNHAKKICEIDASSKEERVLGIIRGIKKITTRKQTPMAFVSIYDEINELECIIFPQAYASYEQLLKNNAILVFVGYLDVKKEGTFIVNAVEEISSKGEQNEQ